MSVITYRDGIMAADSRAYSGGHRPIGRKQKIRRLDDGSLVGVGTAAVGLSEWLHEWVQDGCNETLSLPTGHSAAEFTVLKVTPDGRAFLASDALAMAGPIEAPYFAVGSGASYALGAMAYGASATEAAAIAAEMDPLCGAPISYTTHDSEDVRWL